MHSIRLQAHLIGPREWDPYSKAMYLNHLANVEHMPMNTLISFCGGSSKASEIRNMIAAYNDMEKYYRPLCDDDSQFDIKKFHGFVELQHRNITDALTANGYDKTDFSQWMVDDRFSTLQDVRRLPDILKSKKATEKLNISVHSPDADFSGVDLFENAVAVVHQQSPVVSHV